jgi:transcriptional regulator with XRE-family HTH domain
MRALRRSSAYPGRQAFADYLGITFSTLSNVENGFPISRALEAKIVTKMPWISGDWLQRGNEAHLTGATLQRLLPLLAEESDTTLPRTRAPRSSSKSGA